MAAIPKRASQCEKALVGKQLCQQTIDLAKQALQKDFSPLSDVRASADYRQLAAQNILQKFYLEITSDKSDKNSATRVTAFEVTHYA